MRKFAVLATVFLFPACGSKTNKDGSELQRFEVPSTHQDYAILGQAFHTDKRRFVNVACVEGKVSSTFGNTEARFKLEQDLSFQEVVSRLGGELSVEIDFPLIKTGPEAEYAKDMASSEFANTFHFSWQITPKKEILVPGSYKISAIGQSFIENYKQHLLEKCGNEFVTAIEYGASLNVNMRIEYRNEKDKREISGKIKVKSHAKIEDVEVEGKLKYLSDEVKKSVKITVQAVQRGGNPIHLTNILPENLISCTLENPKPCFDVFVGAIRYAKEDLPKQFKGTESYNVIKYITERYDESGLMDLAPTSYPSLDILVDNARVELDEKFQQALLDQQRAVRLLTSYSEWLNESDREVVEEIQEKAKDNARLYSKAAIRCYESPYEGCLGFVDSVEKAVKSYDRKYLSIEALSVGAFFQCEEARMAAVEMGLVSARFAIGYQKKGWAPIFYNNARPEEGVKAWGTCDDALKTYGDFFKS